MTKTRALVMRKGKDYVLYPSSMIISLLLAIAYGWVFLEEVALWREVGIVPPEMMVLTVSILVVAVFHISFLTPLQRDATRNILIIPTGVILVSTVALWVAISSPLANLLWGAPSNFLLLVQVPFLIPLFIGLMVPGHEIFYWNK